MHVCKKSITFAAKMKRRDIMSTITKAEIAEHYVSVEQMHEDLKNLVHNFYARTRKQEAAA